MSTRDLAAALSGQQFAIRQLMAQAPAPVLAAAAEQGVLCLVARALRQLDPAESTQWGLVDTLRDSTHRAQSVELVRRSELILTLRTLQQAGVRALVLKGAALAYTHYAAPHLRPRVDTDLLVPPKDRARAVEALQSLGYQRQVAVDREAIFTQAMFCRCGVGHVRHVVDLHWRISNRPLFKDTLSYEELWSASVGVAALGESARAPGPVHALLLACIHPAAHHHSEWPLIWVHDLWLLAQQMTAGDWARFRTLAFQKRVSLICSASLERTADLLGPGAWLAESGAMDWPRARVHDEASARYLEGQSTPRQDLMLDFVASRGALAKCRLLLSHAFPDLFYMRKEYGAASWPGLVHAYSRRLTGAGIQLLRARRTKA